MKNRKRIIVEARNVDYISKYCIVGKIRKGWCWKDVDYFGTFRAAMDWIIGVKENKI